MKRHTFSSVLSGVALVSTLALPFAANAQTTGTSTTTTPKPFTHIMKRPMIKRMRGVSGTVASVSGTTITLTVKATSTPDTIDASSAKLMGGIPGTNLPLSDILVGDKITVMGTTSGTTVTAKTITDRSLNGRNIFSGKVTAISGSLITISGLKGATTTIDGTSATITTGLGKNATSTTIGAIKVGDRLTAIGTLSGSTVTATAIYDMVMHKMPKPMMGKGPWAMPKNAAMGKVTAISGTTITISGFMNKTLTVDATSATVTKGFGTSATSSTVSDIQVGDYISAQGTVSGTNVTATSIRDLGVITIPTGKAMPGKGMWGTK